MSDFRQSVEYRALVGHRRVWDGAHLRALFASDAARADRYRTEWPGLLVDWSKHRIGDDTLRLLLAFAEARGVLARRDAMFAGEPINTTEGRAVLHMALRRRSDEPAMVDGQDAMPQVRAVIEQMRVFCAQVHSGEARGASGEPFEAVVHLGIGGSDLGPAMVCEALEPYHLQGMQVRFASNVDGQDIEAALRGLNPARTLVLVASKTFTTAETLANARAARSWIVGALGEAAVGQHFVALSASPDRAADFGISRHRVFGFWDWVGGRYSLWSCIGLPVALAVGMERFEEMLHGAFDVDEHFRSAPAERNLPLILGLLGYWYIEHFGARAHAVLPYDRRLRRLAAYLQQADMESNGKSTGLDGRPVGGATGPVVFGEPGTNAQHSFFQLLHQGTHLVPADFLAAARVPTALPEQHIVLLANFLAQTEALMRGKTQAEARAELLAAGHDELEAQRLAPHKTFEGNRPTTTFLMDELNPRNLGRLLAIFEHRIFVQAALWGINAFDQWGVELGKALARTLEPELSPTAPLDPAAHDASTLGLLQRVRLWRSRPHSPR